MNVNEVIAKLQAAVAANPKVGTMDVMVRSDMTDFDYTLLEDISIREIEFSDPDDSTIEPCKETVVIFEEEQ